MIFDPNLAEQVQDLKRIKPFDKMKLSSFSGDEAAKNIEGLLGLRELVCKEVRKPRPILAMGGGALCDLVGFLASELKSELILLPTTLLAQVDASLGGKTAINFDPYGKNLIGSFLSCKADLLFKVLAKDLTGKGA